MRTLLLLPLAISLACATTPDVATTDDNPKDTAEVAEAPAAAAPRALDARSLTALAERFRCDADQSDIDGLDAIFAECHDDNVMIAFIRSCEGEAQKFCTMDGIARVITESEGSEPDITPEKRTLAANGTTPLYRVRASENGKPIEVLFADRDLPEGVHMAACGFKDVAYAPLCDDLLDELYTGTAAPARAPLELRAELDEEGCIVKDARKPGFNAGWFALCKDSLIVFVAYPVDDPKLNAMISTDSFFSTINKDGNMPAPEALKVDLPGHPGAKIYRIDARQQEDPGLAYFIDQDLADNVKLAACAWRKVEANDARCMSILDRLLK